MLKVPRVKTSLDWATPRSTFQGTLLVFRARQFPTQATLWGSTTTRRTSRRVLSSRQDETRSTRGRPRLVAAAGSAHSARPNDQLINSIITRDLRRPYLRLKPPNGLDIENERYTSIFVYIHVHILNFCLFKSLTFMPIWEVCLIISLSVTFFSWKYYKKT